MLQNGEGNLGKRDAGSLQQAAVRGLDYHRKAKLGVFLEVKFTVTLTLYVGLKQSYLRRLPRQSWLLLPLTTVV